MLDSGSRACSESAVIRALADVLDGQCVDCRRFLFLTNHPKHCCVRFMPDMLRMWLGVRISFNNWRQS